MTSAPIRVMIVDDSATVRKALEQMFAHDAEIEVIETATDPYDAKDKIMRHNPEVLTLDLEMPRMDGLTFLKIIMKQRPMPVIILSTLTQAGTSMAMEALRNGAFDVFGKPESIREIRDTATQLSMKVKEAGWALRNQTWKHRVEHNKTAPPFRTNAVNAPIRTRLAWTGDAPISARHILALGASTGGTEALARVLRKFPPHMPPILIAQHIPARFSHSFAQRLDGECAPTAKEAEDGEIARQGCIYVAPGGKHLTARFNGSHYQLRLNDDEPVWHQRPAVDVLFDSLSPWAGPHMVAALLTGMGKDGASGLLNLRKKGVRTFAESEETCVVYGMPRAAYDLGAPEKMIPIQDMASTIMNAFEESFKGRGVSPLMGESTSPSSVHGLLYSRKPDP